MRWKTLTAVQPGRLTPTVNAHFSGSRQQWAINALR